MAEWRARGYVADSDEDDDSQGSSSTPHPPPNLELFHDIDDLLEPDKGQLKHDDATKSEDSQQRKVVEKGRHNGDEDAAREQTERSDLEGAGSDSDQAETKQSEGGVRKRGGRRHEDDIDELGSDYYGSQRTASGVGTPQETRLRSNASSHSIASSPQVGKETTGASSALSSIPSSPSVGLTQSHEGQSTVSLPTQMGEALMNATHTESITTGGDQLSVVITQQYNVEGTESFPGGRTFRQRNPIQLHPYAIESEKYRQSLKARGIMPLHIVNTQDNDAGAAADESQTVDAVAQRGNQSTSGGSPDREATSSVMAIDNLDSPMHAFGNVGQDDEDGLPDLAALLRSRPQQYTAAGNKRRKLCRIFSRKSLSITTIPTPLPSRYSEAAPHVDEDVSMYDIPASPPLSDASQQSGSHASAPKFKVPRPLTPAALPTPLTSSEPRRRPQIRHSDSGEFNANVSSAEEDDQFDIGVNMDDRLSDDGPAKEMEKVQRRIRGVLPASWLRLDQKTQMAKTGAEDQTAQDRSSEPSKDQRGRARVLTRRPTKSPNFSRDVSLTLSAYDDSQEESESSESLPELDLRLGLTRRTGLDSKEIPVDHCLDQIGEVVEDNRIDAMLASSRRRTTNSIKMSRKRQRQHKSPTTATLPPVSSKSQRRYQYQPRITDKLKRKRQENLEFRPPDVGILDMVSPVRQAPSSIPDFLRVASRTAHLRTDKGRHSPSCKALKLATHADTDEINEILRNWREGVIQPRRSIHEPSSRKPLQPCSGNRELIKPKPGDGKSVGTRMMNVQSTSVAAAKSRHKAIKSQGTLDYVIQQGFPQSAETQSRRYKYTHNSWKSKLPSTRGQVSFGLQTGDDGRPAMLETLQEAHDHERPELAFRQDLLHLTSLSKTVGASDSSSWTAPLKPVHTNHLRRKDGGDSVKAAMCHKIGRIPRRRKQLRPKRVLVELSDHTIPSYPLTFNVPSERYGEAPATSVLKQTVLSGLNGLSGHCESTFGVTPLPTGTRFHKDTFIGSGDFHRSSILSRAVDLNRHRGSERVQASIDGLTWGQWDDEVSTDIGRAFDEVLHFIGKIANQGHQLPTQRKSIVTLQRRILNYVSDHLSYVDPVDRVGFLQRCTSLATSVWLEVANLDASDGQTLAMTHELADLKIEIWTLDLAFANQLCQIAEHDLVSEEIRVQADSLKAKITRCTLSLIMQRRFAVFEQCLRSLQRVDCCEPTLGTEQAALEAFVICCILLSDKGRSYEALWPVFNEVFPIQARLEAAAIPSLESFWRNLFTLLPFLEFNTCGVLEAGKRFNFRCDNWDFVKQLVVPMLDLNKASLVGHNVTFNAYYRILFARCFRLLSDWNWARSDSIIGTLFDFFARNNLAHLKDETAHASPAFLENLAKSPSLDISPNDRCFHILLKTIAKGLQRMRMFYPAKKIRDVVWRLMPNHGRSHPREQAIREEDLEALRNHHDLLCTLYWASPPEFRPRLTTLRNLVQLETSHREACHLNIRAWSYLVQFQLSVQEPLTNLQPFATWHDDLLRQILRQHAQARTEAEEQACLVECQGGLNISKDLLETNIARNQRQVEAVLGDALVRLQLAIAAARNAEAASVLMTTALVHVLDLFDAQQPQSHTVVIEVIDVILAYIKHAVPKPKPSRIRDSNDDSQDYGDWSAFAEDDILPECDSQAAQQTLAVAHIRDKFESPLRHLLSNCFGADSPPKDSFMVEIVNAWIAMASVFVAKGMRCWSDYLSPFGQDSWNSLRKTQQARKFNAYFLARLIEADEDIYFEHREHFLTSWIVCLVERESMLKFQHRLTSALLNVDEANPLLKNLPFWAAKDTKRFDITPTDFSLRRLSLISSILSNMRESMDSAGVSNCANASNLREEYKESLKRLMTAMKHNYQELGPSSNVRGAYVDFAHRVVEYLQQHTSSICPVDRFFTDSSAFPLPVEDPLYVVGQLKNYGLRLQDARTPKQLAVFLQSVSERVATEGKQDYLVDQLYTAMSSEFELGDAKKPTLRMFIVEAILPAYIELAFSTALGWTLVSPFLKALQRIFDRILDVLDGANLISVAAVASTIEAFLESLRESSQLLSHDLSFSEKSETLHVLGECYEAATALLPTLDYLVRLGGPVDNSVQCISYLKSFASTTFGTLSTPYDYDARRDQKNDDQSSTMAIRTFALQELKDSFSRYWSQKDGHIYMARGNTRKEVRVDLGSCEDERNGYTAAVQDFLRCLEILPAFRGEVGEPKAVEGRRGIGLSDVLI